MARHAAAPAALQPARRPARKRGIRMRPASFARAVRCLESAALLGCGAAATLALPAPYGPMPPGWALIATAAACLVASLAPPLTQAGRVCWTLLVAPATAAAAILPLLGVNWRTGLAWEVEFALAASVVLAGLHAAAARTVGRMLNAGRLATRVAVVGAGPAAARALARLGQSDPRRIETIGQYAEMAGPGVAHGLRGNLRMLLTDCRLGTIDAIVVASGEGDAAALLRLRQALRPCIQDVYLSPELMDHAGRAAEPAHLGAIPVLLVSQAPIRGWPAAAKFAFDQLGACLLLLFMAPVLGVIALAIKLELPGPILFRQLRVGYNNQLFYIIKFRSMHHDATDRLAKQQTVYGDRRVTRVGRLIRRFSLDELPQLLNVVRGEMSLVGPRPHAPGTSIGGMRVHHLVDEYACRHQVRPGITGLAQVRGLRGGLHNRQQVADRLAADLEYVRGWSLWLDVKVLLLTAVLELRGSRGF